MHVALPVAILASLVVSANADAKCDGPNAVTEPPLGALVVDGSGKDDGCFTTIGQAVANLPNTTDEHTIFIYPGVYREQVLISKLNGPLVLQGYTCDTMSYAANEVTITHSKAQKDIPEEIINVHPNHRNDLTSTLRLKTDNVRVYNLILENTAGKFSKNGQALAVYANSDKCGFYACSFLSYQDTVCAQKGRQLFALSHIRGAVDFIFGLFAEAWFDSCDIETVGKGAITANGRNDTSNPSFYVLNRARVYASPTWTNTSQNFLGRPWKLYSRTVWQNSELSDVINPKGWQEWNHDNNTGNVTYKEYNNTGPGAAPDKRVYFSGQLSAPVGIDEILGESYASEGYVDKRFLP